MQVPVQNMGYGRAPDAVDEDAPLVQPVRHGEPKVLVDRVLEKAHPHHLQGHPGGGGPFPIP